MSKPELSVLIPFYNEEGNVLPLLEEVHEALSGISFEVVCVNDRARPCGCSNYGSPENRGASISALHDIFWPLKHGGQGGAHEWNDPRAR